MDAATKMYCTSVDDAKITIKRCTSIKNLEAALQGERNRSNRTSLIKALESRIRRLKKEGGRV